MDLFCSLSYLQQPAILPLSEAQNIVQRLPPYLKYILILCSDLRLGLPSDLFPSDFAATSSYLILATSHF
jgi:hypothetical protein